MMQFKNIFVFRLNSRRKILPNILLVSLLSQFFIYYYNVFNGMYPDVAWLVVLANLCMILGYVFGSKFNIKLNSHKKIVCEKYKFEYNYSLIRRIAIAFIFTGLLAHVYFYSNNIYSNYADSYTVSRGQGFITVFFNFLLVGMILLETLSIYNQNSRKIRILNRFLMLIYSLVYFFIFLKRRQIIILLLAIIALRRDTLNKKFFMWVACALVILLFTIYGKLRGYITVYGFENIWNVFLSDFSIEWIQFENFEGKYISRTLDDVYNYVNTNGIDPSVMYGILCCFIPRAFFEDNNKPVAFPEWYTMHFFPNDYARGTGYAGSIIAELYLIGWLPLVICVFFAFGYLFSKLEKFSDNRTHILKNIIYAISIYNIIVLPRYDFASIIIDLVFLYLPIILVFKKATMRKVIC